MNTIQEVISTMPNNHSGPSMATKPQPACPVCGGLGYVRADYELCHPNFGKLTPCPKCREPQIKQKILSRVYEYCELKTLSDKSFENFDPTGNASLFNAFKACKNYARIKDGWLVMAGGVGCGKTHLAAAIANQTDIPCLFVTVPDMLDMLRAGFNSDATWQYSERMEAIRKIDMLIMDDLGVENNTPWAAEKIFQLINYRYINKAPTVFTTNVMPENLDGRIYSRLRDTDLVQSLGIDASDYRRRKNK